MDVVVIGGNGTLGRLVCIETSRRGHRAIPLGRRDGDLRDPALIARAAPQVIINCAGASVGMGLGQGGRGYHAVDVPIGLAAVAAAHRSNARLVYVGVHHPPALRATTYVDAHERVAAAMRDLDGVVVRPTGFFAAITAAYLPMAQRGRMIDIGDGSARTNPICERDLAEIVVDAALRKDGPRDVSVGGPEVMTRGAMLETIAGARPVKTSRLPIWLARTNAALLRIVHPRMGQFLQFVAGLAAHDVIAPAVGTTTLAGYVAALPAAKAA